MPSATQQNILLNALKLCDTSYENTANKFRHDPTTHLLTSVSLIKVTWKLSVCGCGKAASEAYDIKSYVKGERASILVSINIQRISYTKIGVTSIAKREWTSSIFKETFLSSDAPSCTQLTIPKPLALQSSRAGSSISSRRA